MVALSCSPATEPIVEAIALSRDSVTTHAGGFEVLFAKPLGHFGVTLKRTVSWSSSDSNVVRVISGSDTSSGVYLRRPGLATITASSGGKSAQAIIRVLPVRRSVSPASFTFNSFCDTIRLEVSASDTLGKSVPIYSGTFQWYSRAPEIFTVENRDVPLVDSTGLLVRLPSTRAVAAGAMGVAAGYVVAEGTDTLAFTGTVLVNATRFRVATTSGAVTVTLRALGDTVRVTGNPIDSRGCWRGGLPPGTTFASSNPSAVSVSSSGRVTAVGSTGATPARVYVAGSTTDTVLVTVDPSAPAPRISRRP
jgi:hypothetical protein